MGGKSSSAPKTTTTAPTAVSDGKTPNATDTAAPVAERSAAETTKAVGDEPQKAANVAGSIAADDAKRSRYRGMKRDPGSTMGANQGLKTSAVLTG